MSGYEKKEVLQAILIADTNVATLRPFSDDNSTALLPIVNVAMLDYALEALSYSGVEEVYLYSSLYLQNIRDYVKRGMETGCSWSVAMNVHVIGGEGSRGFGDAMRDLDAKALIRGNFIILGVDTVTNADFRPIFEQHKKTVSYDKGAAATLIFKEIASTGLRTGNEVMIAMDMQNKRLHHHQRLHVNNKERRFDVPLEVFINNSQVELMHNLLDPQMAIGSPSMLSLFSDNFDFETRDDFVRGLLINEEILDSRIYVALLPREQYARRVNNWLSYQIASQDIINRWAYPLAPDMGIHRMSQQYIFLKNNIYKSRTASVTKIALRENVVVQDGCTVDAGTVVSYSVLGSNCKIGANCRLKHAFLMDNVSIADGCVLEYCVIGAGSVLNAHSTVTEGTIIAPNCLLPAKCSLKGAIVKAKHDQNGDDADEIALQLGERAFIIADRQLPILQSDDCEASDSDVDGDDDDDQPKHRGGGKDAGGFLKMTQLPLVCEESDYSSSSDDEDDASYVASPLPDDTNIFLSEVIDSLARGFQEKSNPDFLILEINSSRYAYNMSLKEVNFYVVKAIFSLPHLKAPPENQNVMQTVNNVLRQLGPVLTNYIKTPDAMIECLKALEDVYVENSHLREKFSQVVHYLYDKDYVTDDAILQWHEQLDVMEHKELKHTLHKLIEWLNQSSEEEDDDSED